MTDEHLTDEILSAVLDGEATPAEARHASDCETCAARLAVLQRAASVIGSPVPRPTDAARETAIARALEARVVPLTGRHLPMGWLAAAAAVIVAVALAVPLVRSSGDGADDRAAAPTTTQELSAGASSAAPAPPVDLGDLGGVDSETLAARVKTGLAPKPAAAADSAATGSGSQLREVSKATPCVEHFRDGSSDFGVLRGTGTARVDGRDAVVLVFASAEGRIRVFAVAPDACDDVLLSVTYAE